jgi:major membrane immunogen (membrane-anchored lipoprotein)
MEPLKNSYNSLKIRSIASLFFCALLLTDCGKKNNDPAPNTQTLNIGGEKLEYADVGTVSNVVKQSNATEVKLEDMQAFEKEEGGKLTFKNTAASIKALKPGQVVLFEGYELKKIVSITETGGKIVATTTDAKFTDYYKSAKINYTKKMSWTESTIKNARFNVGGRLSAFSETRLDNGVEFSGTIANFAISLKLTPEAGGGGRKLNVEMTARRGNLAGIQMKGFISDFSAESDIDVADSQINTYNHQHNNLNGELEVKYAFLTLSEIAQISIPLEISRTILVQGVIPVTFTMKANLKVFPEVAANSTCQAHLKLTYNGTQGFNYNNRSLQTAGTIGGFDVTRLGDTGSASEGIVGVGVGLEFPRFSIGVFHNLVVPYILNNTSVVSYFESGLPFVPGPCNQTVLKLKGVVGVDMSFFGLSYSGSQDLYEKTREFKTAGSRCPEASMPKVSAVMGEE